MEPSPASVILAIDGRKGAWSPLLHLVLNRKESLQKKGPTASIGRKKKRKNLSYSSSTLPGFATTISGPRLPCEALGNLPSHVTDGLAGGLVLVLRDPEPCGLQGKGWIPALIAGEDMLHHHGCQLAPLPHGDVLDYRREGLQALNNGVEGQGELPDAPVQGGRYAPQPRDIDGALHSFEDGVHHLRGAALHPHHFQVALLLGQLSF